MEAVKFSSKSWHWHIATLYGPIQKNWYKNRPYDADICTYTRAVARGLFLLALLSVVAFFLALSLVHFFIWVYVGFTIAWVKIETIGILTPVIIATVVAFATIIFFGMKYDEVKEYLRCRKERNDKEPKEPEPSLLKEWYRKVKDKTCFRVQIT